MISTPINPTAVARQRRTPTLSPRKTIDSAVTNSGATKLVADASAMGRNRKPEIKNSEEDNKAMLRISCKPGRREGNANSGEPGNIAGDMISANTRNLIQAISIDGNVADRYFAVTSEAPRNTVEARISAMPRNGRSARAGAVRAAGFFSGEGNGALSSLAAAAVGGVTVELGAQGLSNRASAQKTIIALHRQATKTGSRYARLRAAARRSRRGNSPSPLKQFVRNHVRYSIGRLRGLGPRGKALSRAAISSSPSLSLPAAALSAARSGVEAFGIANSWGSRVRKLKATWRGDAACASAMACSTSPALLCGCGKSL